MHKHDYLVRHLAAWARRQGFHTWRELSLLGGLESPRPDVIMVKAPDVVRIVDIKRDAHALKVSLNRGKYQKYLPYCSAFYFGVEGPEPVCQLPPTIGLYRLIGGEWAVDRQPRVVRDVLSGAMLPALLDAMVYPGEAGGISRDVWVGELRGLLAAYEHGMDAYFTGDRNPHVGAGMGALSAAWEEGWDEAAEGEHGEAERAEQVAMAFWDGGD